jgi:heme/copper-type cytochrome/quinol oxidase subunit 3
MSERVLDVSALEEETVDSRSLLWWGNLGMMAIEGTMFAMLIATYLYLKMVNLDWPPSTVPYPDLLWPTVNLAILLLTFIPALILDRAALRDDVPLSRLALGVCVVAGLAFIAIRFLVLANLGYKWSDHAYGSVVWTCIGFHLLHVIAATAETALLFVYSLLRPIVKKQLLDFRCLAVYWFFVIVMWLPFYFIIFIEPYLSRKGS